MKSVFSSVLFFTSAATLRKTCADLKRAVPVLAFVAALVTPLSHAGATTFTYSGTVSNTAPGDSWSAGTNWSAVPVSGTDTTLVFNGALAAAATVFSNNDIPGNFQLNALNFTAAGPATGTAPVETINGNTLEFISNGGTAPTLTINSTGTVKPTLTINNALQLDNDLTVAATTNGTLAGAIGGTAGFIKNGAGAVTFGSTNTYGGATTVNAGILALGATTQTFNGLTIAGSGALTGVTGSVLNLNGDVTYDGSANLAAGNGGANFAVATLNLNGTRTFNIGDSTASGQDVKITSIIANGTGTGILVKSGAGVLNINNASNSYSGGTTVQAGVFLIGANNAAGSGAIELQTGSTLVYDNVAFNNVLNVTGNANIVATTNQSATGPHTGALIGSGTLTFASSVVTGGKTFTAVSSNKYSGDMSGFTGTIVDNTNTNVIFQGVATNGSASAKFQVNGTNFVGVSQASGNTNRIFNMGEVSGSSSGIIQGDNSGTANTVIYQVGALGTSTTYAGAFANGGVGVVALTKVGTGTLTLSGANAYTGATTVSGGKLLVSGSLSGTASVAVTGTGSTLSVNGLVKTAVLITNTGGTVQGQGTVGAVATTGGTLAPGFTTVNAVAGTLTSSGTGISLDNASNFNIRLGVAASSDNDALKLTTGNVALGGASLQLTLGGAYANQGTGFTYVIINGTTAGSVITGQFAQGNSITDTNGEVFNILYNVDATGTVAGNDVVLQLTSIPEPGTWGMLLGGLGILVCRHRRRTRLAY